jgi:monovalent cation:H+ antiporter-2, CPA2 family
VLYGDAGSPVVLEAAGIRDARLLLVTVPAAFDVELTVDRARALNPEVHIVARAERLGQMEELRAKGVHELIQPEFECGLEMVRQTLVHLGMPAMDIQRFTDSVRDELYRPLYTQHIESHLLKRLERAEQSLEIEWFSILESSALVSKTLAESNIRGRTGASIVTVLRGEQTLTNPGPELVFQPGDILGVIGTAAQRDQFRSIFPKSKPS